MKFLAALQFLTIIPLPWRREVSPEEVGRSIGYFPMVGIIIGLILVSLSWLLGLLLPLSIVNGLLIICLVVISGALHLDGFIDTCDGIAGHKRVEDRWQVMHDSRAGGFGIVGVCCLLLVKYLSLNSIPEPLLMATLVLMPVVSRWAMVYAVFAYPYAKPSGLGKVFKQEANWHRLAMATFTALVVAVILAQLSGLAMILGIWVIVMAMAAYLKGKFAGLTGDNYGAINEVAEVGVLILVSLLAHNQWLWLA
ncbi:MAG: adenosylcobinamide-GDP ribazoletransferase [Dehalococcoidales bacterium]|nr:adenosylcobinamide-GDP ribazoletransferase [Dehalococcoidales bacterium]